MIRQVLLVSPEMDKGPSSEKQSMMSLLEMYEKLKLRSNLDEDVSRLSHWNSKGIPSGCESHGRVKWRTPLSEIKIEPLVRWDLNLLRNQMVKVVCIESWSNISGAVNKIQWAIVKIVGGADENWRGRLHVQVFTDCTDFPLSIRH